MKTKMMVVDSVGCQLLMAAERGCQPCFQKDTGPEKLEAEDPRKCCSGVCWKQVRTEPKEKIAEKLEVEKISGELKARKVRRATPKRKRLKS